MLTTALEALRGKWLQLAREYEQVRREAVRNGVASGELEALDCSYNLQIDLMVAEIKVVESLARLSERFDLIGSASTVR